MMNDQTSTIAALATAPGTGGIGIIRVSGPEAVSLVQKIYQSPSGRSLEKARTHTIHYGFIKDPATNEVIDQVLVMLMRAPHTYTGEDTVEVQCHGGPYVEQKILETLVSIGAEPADRGEFSKRAFLNGKMDLSQAEAVMDLIQSNSEMSRKASMEQLEGHLARAVEGLLEKLLDLTTMIEANIDYPENDVEEVTYDRLLQDTESLLNDLHKLYDTADSGIRVREGLRTAIIGSPNVGKSSLMNRILGRDRAIVTQIAGTTRDVIEESVDFYGIPLRLSDTAGIRQTEDTVEKIGVDLAMEAARKADLILYVLDGTRLEEAPEQLAFDKPCLLLANKEDLVGQERPETLFGQDILWISAKTGEGMEEVGRRIKEMFFGGQVGISREPMITNIRQKEALRRAIEALSSAKDAAESGLPEDILMIDYTNAYDALGEISGRSLKSDVIDEIFKRFCLGK